MDAAAVEIAVFDQAARVPCAKVLAGWWFDRKLNAGQPIRCGDFIGCVFL